MRKKFFELKNLFWYDHKCYSDFFFDRKLMLWEKRNSNFRRLANQNKFPGSRFLYPFSLDAIRDMALQSEAFNDFLNDQNEIKFKTVITKIDETFQDAIKNEINSGINKKMSPELGLFYIGMVDEGKIILSEDFGEFDSKEKAIAKILHLKKHHENDFVLFECQGVIKGVWNF